MTRSPLGSMTTVPRPAWMSSRIMLSSRVVLPEPVEPSTCRCWRASATLQRDRVAADLGVAEDLGAAPAGGDRDRGGHRLGPGPVQAGDGEVVRQRGEGGQLGGVEQEPAAQHPGGQDPRRGAAMRQAAQPVAAGRRRRTPTRCRAARLASRGASVVGVAAAAAGVGDGVADGDLPLRRRRACRRAARASRSRCGSAPGRSAGAGRSWCGAAGRAEQLQHEVEDAAQPGGRVEQARAAVCRCAAPARRGAAGGSAGWWPGGRGSARRRPRAACRPARRRSGCAAGRCRGRCRSGNQAGSTGASAPPSATRVERAAAVRRR